MNAIGSAMTKSMTVTVAATRIVRNGDRAVRGAKRSEKFWRVNSFTICVVKESVL